jgi:hypothetical protein
MMQIKHFLMPSLLLVAACAQDQPVVDTVQPSYTAKRDLLGREWYMRTTVIDTKFTNAQSFPGAMGGLARGVFEVQEKALFFYRTYEFLAGSEAYAQKSDTDTPLKDADGHPVMHAVPQDYQKIACSADSACHAGARCANAARTGEGDSAAWQDEGDWQGFCVNHAQAYVYRGSPLMAFPITSHFDISYTYSTATGEKTNKRYENTSDRKWYDREFMRVQWGANQLLSFDADVLASTGASVVYAGDSAPAGEGFQQGVDKKCSDNSSDCGDPFSTQAFFTYTHRQILTAKMLQMSDGSQVPACFFAPYYVGGLFDCASEEYTVRTFFLEVPKYSDPQRQYVAREMDDVEMQKFGFFRSERQVYDIQFGNIFSNEVRRAVRHRIWDKYVKKLDADGAWRGDFDYTQMTPQPIVYYLNDAHPRELVAQSIAIAKMWSEPFEAVVKFQKPSFKLDFPMFVLCENSDAQAQAAIAAGGKQDDGKWTPGPDGQLAPIADGTVAQWSGTDLGRRFCRNMAQSHVFGDLRWSFMHVVNQPLQNNLYGYGPAANDPLTGEIISASAHSYVSAMKTGAESALQAMELAAGILDFNDVERASEKKYVVHTRVVQQYDLKGPKSLDEVREHVAAMLDPEVRAHLENTGLEQSDAAGTWAQSRMARIQMNSQLDEMLIGDDDGHTVQALFKLWNIPVGQSAIVTDADRKQLSLANWANKAGYQSSQAMFDKLAERTVHFAEFADGAILGLAQQYGARYDEALCKAYQGAQTPTLMTWKAESTPAVGCPTLGAFESLGLGKGRICVAIDQNPTWATCSAGTLAQQLRLALNDVGSDNSPYNVQQHVLPGPFYTDTNDPLIRATQQIGRDVIAGLRADIKSDLWQQIYRGTAQHEVGHTLGLRHNFEASTDALNYHKHFWDLKLDPNGAVVNPFAPETAAQSQGSMRMHMVASVMDYTAKFNSRFLGVGLYDKAALKFGYGDMVQVFDHPPVLDAAPDAGLAPMAQYLATPQDSDPSVVMLQDHGVTDLNKINRRIHYTTLPKYYGGVSNMYARHDVSWRDIKGTPCAQDSDCGGKICAKLGEASFCADKATRASEVPFRFCSDEYNGQTPSCATFDEGADPYEITRNALEDYENYWFFWGYMRDNELFNPNDYSSRVQRQFLVANRQMQFWAIDFATYQKNGWWKARYGKDFDQDVNGGLSGAFASLLGFNTMAQTFGRPNPGYYDFNALRGRFEPYNQIDNQQVDLHWIDELSGARPIYSAFGGGYLYRPVTAGQIYDRLAAFQMLSDPTLPRFIGINESEDTRRYLVSYFTLFPRQLINIFGGISFEGIDSYGWMLLQGASLNGSEDTLLRPLFAGANVATPKLCADYPAGTSLKDKVGCVKYRVYPDPRPTFPSTRFRMPLLGSLYGMSFLTKGYDRTYLDLARVFVAGNQAQITLPDDVSPGNIAKFIDPLSGRQYVAAKASDKTLNPGYEAVLAAQKELAKYLTLDKLQADYLFSEYQFRVSLLDLVRTMHEVYEY